MTTDSTGNFGLPAEVVQKICRVLSAYPAIKRATLYGSRAKGNYRRGSDIDLCLDAPTLDIRTQLELENRLDDLLLPWKIDLVARHNIANPALLEHIDRVGILFSEDNGANRISGHPGTPRVGTGQ
jgi:predicted nucleotidyltransferase